MNADILVGGCRLMLGDARERLRDLAANSIHACITSPPYWGLRSYLTDGHADKAREIGLEASVGEYVAELVGVFREVRRVLRPDGTLWLVLGDVYAGNKVGNTNGTGASGLKRDGRPEASRLATVAKQGADMATMRLAKHTPDGLKPKDLIGLPWRVAFALQADGWWLRSDIIWSKSNPMPESVRDRPTRAHETVFLLSKSPSYYFDADAVKEDGIIPAGTRGAKGSVERFNTPGVNSRPPEYKVYGGKRNIRSVWTIPTQPFSAARYGLAVDHFATMPPELAERCIKAGTSERGCCRTCGAPWERVVERKPLAADALCTADRKPLHGPTYSRHKVSIPGGQSLVGYTAETTGWEPGCGCVAGDPVPCTALDPFAGAGTTLLVAERLQRRSIGIELNPEYVEMAARRLRNDAPLFAEAVA